MQMLQVLCPNNNKHTHFYIELSINKFLIKPVWTYDIQGNVKKSNLNKIQIFQNIVLRKLPNVPSPYVSNDSIHSDLKLKSVHDEAKTHYKRLYNRLISNLNSLTVLYFPSTYKVRAIL